MSATGTQALRRPDEGETGEGANPASLRPETLRKVEGAGTCPPLPTGWTTLPELPAKAWLEAALEFGRGERWVMTA